MAQFLPSSVLILCLKNPVTHWRIAVTQSSTPKKLFFSCSYSRCVVGRTNEELNHLHCSSLISIHWKVVTPFSIHSVTPSWMQIYWIKLLINKLINENEWEGGLPITLLHSTLLLLTRQASAAGTLYTIQRSWLKPHHENHIEMEKKIIIYLSAGCWDVSEFRSSALPRRESVKYICIQQSLLSFAFMYISTTIRCCG